MHRTSATALKILFIILGINFLLDWYVYNGLKKLTAGWRRVVLRQVVKGGYLFVSIGVTVLFVLGVGSYRTARGMTPYHEWMLSLFLVFFITTVFSCLALLLGDTGRLLYGVGRKVVKPGERGPLVPGRRRFQPASGRPPHTRPVW